MNSINNFYKKNKLLVFTICLLIFIYMILILISVLLNINQNARMQSTVQFIDPNLISWIEIFRHNIGASFLMLSLGLVSCGFFSSLILVFNFYTLFLGFSQAYYISGNIFYTFFIISTHGILEMISLSIFYYVSTWSIRQLINLIYAHEIVNNESIRKNVKLIVVAIVLLLVASLTEAYITPVIVNYLAV